PPGLNTSAVDKLGPPCAPKPPVTNTLPSASNVAVWAMRGEWRLLKIFCHEFVFGLYTSAVLGSVELSPPTTSTRPDFSNVAVCCDRAAVISLGVHFPVL